MNVLKKYSTKVSDVFNENTKLKMQIDLLKNQIDIKDKNHLKELEDKEKVILMLRKTLFLASIVIILLAIANAIGRN